MNKLILTTAIVSFIYFGFMKFATSYPATVAGNWAIGTMSFCFIVVMVGQLIKAWEITSKEDAESTNF